MTAADEKPFAGPFPKAFEAQPVEFRELLVELFFEADRVGLGTALVGFRAEPGLEERAAAYIGKRAEYVPERRFSM